MNAPLPLTRLEPRPETDAPILRFEGVAKVYPARRGSAAVQALENIDLTLAAGSVLGVIGRSGAGKSTLIRLVNGLERPSAGRVVVNGLAISDLGERDLRRARRSIGMIFQHFNLLSSRTVADNVALPLELSGADAATTRRRVGELLDLVGLADKQDRYPAELSGGQKQRVGIARALATRPAVLLSDEATSALDPETTRQILALLRDINAALGVTILFITHEMAVVRGLAHQVAVLEGGRIVEQGDVFEVFTRPAHPVTRSFLGSEAGRALPAYLNERLRDEPVPGGETLLRIGFRGPHATDPILARLAREAGIDANIVAGAVDEIAGRPFGTLVVSLGGGAGTVERARAFLTAHGLDTEVIGHVA